MRRISGKGKKARCLQLSLAVFSALLVSSTSTVMAIGSAKTSPITGVVSNDASTYGATRVVEKDGVVQYKLFNTTITPSNNNQAPISLKTTKPVVITAGGSLFLEPQAGGMVSGISLGDNQNLKIQMLTHNPDRPNYLYIASHSTGYSSMGINITREGGGDGARSDITIEGPIMIGDTSGDSDSQWGVTAENDFGYYSDYKGARWQPVGVYLGQSKGSTITLDGGIRKTSAPDEIVKDGNIDIAVKGTAIETDPYYASSSIPDETKLSIITLKNANIALKTPKSSTESFYSIANYGGTINVNAENDAKPDDIVKIDGNMIAMSNKLGKGDPYYYRSGVINVGLLNKDSYWRGVVDNAGDGYYGDVNLTMKNGATWYHEALSPTNGLNVETMPVPSNKQYGSYDGITHIHTLTANPENTPEAATRIFAKAATPIEIDKYSGHAYVLYSHKNDGTTPSDFVGGPVKVKSANENSTIALATDKENINTGDTAAVKKVFENLAGKLYYLGAKAGKESNLTGSVNILEGLTSPSLQSLVTKNVLFSSESGQGYLEGSESSPTVDPGPTSPEKVGAGNKTTDTYVGKMITGNIETDKVMKDNGVTSDGRTYTFTKDTTFTLGGEHGASVMDLDTNLDHGVTINGDQATIIVDGSQAGEKGIQAFRTEDLMHRDQVPIEINVKAININLDSEKARQEGFHFKETRVKAGSDIINDKRETITINSDVNATIKGNVALGVYTYGNYDVILNKAVNLNVDGLDGGWQNMGGFGLYASGAMGVFAPPMGSSITVNGPYTFTGNGNGAWVNTAASIINLRGDTTITVQAPKVNYRALAAQLGTISVNYKPATSGAGPTTYGKEVRITGDLATDRSADYFQWQEPGFDAKYRSSIINVGLDTPTSFLKGVAYNQESATSIANKYVDEINLLLAKGATWTNDVIKNTPFYREDRRFKGSHIHTFTGGNTKSDAGYIVQKHKRPITIDDYTGHAVVFFEHDTDPATFHAGNIILKKVNKISGASPSNSSIILATDNNNIDTNNTEIVDKVFDALAKKIQYENYKDGERNLDGSLEIREGLTAGSAVKKTGFLYFKEDDGTGYYSKKEIGAEETPDHQIVSALSQSLAGTIEHDTAYKRAGIMKIKTLTITAPSIDDGEEDDNDFGAFIMLPAAAPSGGQTINYPEYDFTKATTITAAEAFKTKGSTGDDWHATIYRNTPVTDSDHIEAYSTQMKLNEQDLSTNATSEGNVAGVAAFNGANITMDGTKKVVVTVNHTGDDGRAVGLIADGAGSNINLKGLTISSPTVDLTVNVSDGDKAVTAIEATSNGAVTIAGKIHATVNKSSYGIHSKGGDVAIKSGGELKADGGTAILNEADGSNRGKVVLNMFGSGIYIVAGEASTDLTLSGDVVTKKSDTYLGLAVNKGNAKTTSTWHGGALTTDNGKLVLALQKGGQWFHEPSSADITESSVTTLNSGMRSQEGDTGYIWQNSEKNIHVGTYSGYTTVFYKHDTANPTTIKGGQFIIDTVKGDATGHPAITLATDGSNVSDDQAKAVLNALAGKLVWTGVDNSIDTSKLPTFSNIKYGLIGTVRLTEGLTVGARTMRMGNIAYYDTAGDGHVKGQGYLQATPANQVINQSETMDDDRTVDTDAATTIGTRQVAAAMYTNLGHESTNPMAVDLNGHDLAVKAKGTTDNKAVAATVSLGANQVLNVEDSKAADKTLHVTAINEDTRGANGVLVSAQAKFTSDVPVVVDEVKTKGMSAVGVEAFGDTSSAHFKKDLTITALNADGTTIRTTEDKGNGRNIVGLEALGPSSTIDVDGTFTIKNFSGVAASSTGGNSKISLQGADIAVNKPASDAKEAYALSATKGSITVNGTVGNNGFTPGAKKVSIVGDIESVSKEGKRVQEYSDSALVDDSYKSTVNLALTTSDSSWTGASMYNKKLIDYGNHENGGVVADSEYDRLKAATKGAGFTREYPGDVNLVVNNGATWTNEVQNKKIDSSWTGSALTSLKGGDNAENSGIIVQKDNKPINVENYEGFVRVFFPHDPSTPTTFSGGDIIIDNAKANSNIILFTDNAGISGDSAAATSADKVLAALAGKITYKGAKTAADALHATVEIREGLTSPSATKMGNVQFKQDGEDVGKGFYKAESTPTTPEEHPNPSEEHPSTGGDQPGEVHPGTGQPGEVHPGTGGGQPGEVHPGTGGGQPGEVHRGTGGGQPGEVHPGTEVSTGGIELGNPDTAIMRGVRSSFITPVITLRETINDVYKRLGDIRNNNTNEGAWALFGGGKAQFDKDGVESNYKYTDLEVGYDTTLSQGWKAGLMFQRLQGDLNGSFMTGTGKTHAIGLYGTQLGKNGHYTDIITKFGKMSNDVHVDNGEGIKANGDVDGTGFLFSVEHGVRMERANGFYVEPQAELSYMHMSGGDYKLPTTFNNGTVLMVKQDAYSSLIGRLGYAVGYKTATGSAYVKVSANHEFLGRFDTTYSAAGQPTKTIRTDLGDTWLSLQFGGTRVLSKNAYIYGNALSSFGGHYRNTWKANLGLRFSF